MKKNLIIIILFICLMLFVMGCSGIMAVANLVAYNSARSVPDKIEPNTSIVIMYIGSTTSYARREGFENCFITQSGALNTRNDTYTGTSFEVFVENTETKESFLIFEPSDVSGQYPLSQFRISKNLPTGSYVFKELLWHENSNEEKKPFSGNPVMFSVDKPGDVIYLGEFVIPEPGTPQIYKLGSPEDKERLINTQKKLEELVTTGKALKFYEGEEDIKDLWSGYTVDELHAIFYFYAGFKRKEAKGIKTTEWTQAARNKIEALKQFEGFGSIEAQLAVVDAMKKKK
ncbi:MAG: hypothetical protein JW904_10475 [Spirochaetales bacterium]|nr:hypothetical protein [Spirochaetales bacterium]